MVAAVHGWISLSSSRFVRAALPKVQREEVGGKSESRAGSFDLAVAEDDLSSIFLGVEVWSVLAGYTTGDGVELITRQRFRFAAYGRSAVEDSKRKCETTSTCIQRTARKGETKAKYI